MAERELHVTVVEDNWYWCVCGFESPVFESQRYADLWAGTHENGPVAQAFLHSTRVVV